MNLEFARRFNKPELILKEFKHWVDNDWPKGTTLGKVEVDTDTLMKIKNDMMK